MDDHDKSNNDCNYQTRNTLILCHNIDIQSSNPLVGDFNTSLTPMARSSEIKINKEREALNDTIDQIDLIDIYRTFYPKTADYTFFSSAHGTLSTL